MLSTTSMSLSLLSTALALLLVFLSCPLPHAAGLVMPQVFGSHMVLQRAPLRAKLWGTVQPDSSVICWVDNDPWLLVQADGAGRFMCELPPYELSWNRTVSVSGDGQTLTFLDVAFGDVVLCLGYAATHKLSQQP